MRAGGYEPEDFENEEFEVWPENWQAAEFFADYCVTQWRVGMGGATGLDYTAVIAALKTLRLSRDRFDSVFKDVRVMEMAALGQMAKK